VVAVPCIAAGFFHNCSLPIPHFSIIINSDMGFPQSLLAKIRSHADDLLDKVPPEKRRFVPVAAISALVVVLLFFLAGLLLSRKTDGREVLDMTNTSSVPQIPPEELFLPEEPDFVPGVLLERDRRSSWTEEDASVYWRDPLRDGEEQWREEIETVIDEFMERVP